MACWLLGALVAPQNTTEDDRRLAFILRDSGASVFLARPEYLERAQRLAHEAPNIAHLLTFGGEALAGYPHLETASAAFGQDFTPSLAPRAEDEALLVYTSGTTGAPKGVILTQANLLYDAASIADWHAFDAKTRLMCVLPIHHVNGIVVTLVTPLLVGGSVVLNRAFSPRHFWERLAREGVHVVSVVPTLLQFCLDYADQQAAQNASPWGEGVTRQDLAHFRHLICGAGTLAVALVTRFEAVFGFRVMHGYGLSETTCYSCFLPLGLSQAEHQSWLTAHGYPSIGCPLDVNEMAIFSPDGSGRRLGAGERGEICVRGPNVMKYYFKRPDANAETFKFGWFRTGDEGFFLTDETGRPFFFITGRLKELINRGGVKFSPFEIEEVLLSITGVKVGLAVAFENRYYGEEVGAYIVPQDGAELSAEFILREARTRLGFEKSPKAVVFGTEIPVTTTGKYQRLRLQPLFEAWRETQFKDSKG
jgi:long-chain acyl-CoA synthetase